MHSIPDRHTFPLIGLALGSGSARGWSHIGVIKVLEDAGVSPSIVCGTSIGALVGAAYAAGELNRLETWVRNLTWQSVMALLDVKFGGGLISGAKLLDFFRSQFADPGIGGLPKTYGAVATELASGREVWLRNGSVIEAVRASIALPGLFTPGQINGKLLVDGGLVNPVPVSLCRALGAEIVIAVDLNWELLGRHYRTTALSAEPPEETPPALASILAKLPLGLGKNEQKPSIELPSILDVLATSLNIMQVRITRSRLAGDPADIMIRPRLADIALMDYHRASLSIDEGRRAAELALPQIKELIAGR
ncbi:MAG TPA: patatin-like phospholipase family protein [Gammaproteobacteria bacterium]